MLQTKTQLMLNDLGINEWIISDKLGEVQVQITEITKSECGLLKLYDATVKMKAKIEEIEKELITWDKWAYKSLRKE